MALCPTDTLRLWPCARQTPLDYGGGSIKTARVTINPMAKVHFFYLSLVPYDLHIGVVAKGHNALPFFLYFTIKSARQVKWNV
uniref:Uncharacterized protein n=1 Tax=Xenopus tropicalis TaxID=8364 RepID=A0A1B8Y8Y5_XENTR